MVELIMNRKLSYLIMMAYEIHIKVEMILKVLFGFKGVEDQVDYQKFNRYSIVTYSSNAL